MYGERKSKESVLLACSNDGKLGVEWKTKQKLPSIVLVSHIYQLFHLLK